MTRVFSDLSQGNDVPLLDIIAEEMTWNWMGSGQWSKSFVGKEQVLGELWKNVRDTIKKPYKVEVHNIIADGDYVVVEVSGQNETVTENSYKNKYCWVCLLRDGKLYQINEYMDTELVTNAFKS